MATLYGNQYTDAFVSVPSVKIKPGYVGGTDRVLYFDYTVTAAPSNNDVIKLGKIPKGALVTEAIMSFPDLGTAGTLELGWAASADGTTEAASASGFLSAVDVNTAAAIVRMTGVSGAAAAGYLKEFAAECDLQIKVTAAWTATTGTIKGVLKYVIV